MGPGGRHDRVRARRGQAVKAVALALLAAGLVLPSAGARGPSLTGGTYRVGFAYAFQNAGFDPTTEGQPGSFGIYANLLLRTLVGHDHVAGAAGRKIVADLATSVPAPTNGGTRYTFTLRRGVRFGPPVSRPIRSSDVRYAIERLARPANYAAYPFYFSVIKGFDAYRAGRGRTIAGISTPDRRTIVFDLVRPTGDFLERLALPAAAPIPPEVGRCFEGKPGAYGRDLIASGPYMVDGSDAVRIGSCAAIRPMRGISDTQLTLVRNPSYDPRTDSRAARENHPDRFVFVAFTHGGQARNDVEIVKKLAAGELEDSYLSSWPTAIDRYLAAARRHGLVRVDPADWVVFMTLNLTRPPFDDVHVRRAMNWLLDRAALRATLPGAGRIARHIVPDDLLGGRLAGYAPFATKGDHGSLAKARAEMRKSRYGDPAGMCVAKACKGVFLSPLVNSSIYAAGQRMTPLIRASAARIGITFAVHSRDAGKMLDPTAGIPSAPNMDWLMDYPDPAAFVDQFFDGKHIRPVLNFNFSLVGITRAQARRLGVKGRVAGRPSVDADIAACSALAGPSRLDCYARLDEKLTTQIVPWVPLIQRDRLTVLGPQVARWVYDSSTDTTGYAHVSVKR